MLYVGPFFKTRLFGIVKTISFVEASYVYVVPGEFVRSTSTNVVFIGNTSRMV